jgi:DNA-binding winged helix-turn-helix (wHTH) protein
MRRSSGATIAASAVASFRFGPFRLVPDQRRLEQAGVAVAVTPKAFDLLVVLVSHRDRALSKDEILELVWPGAVVEEGNLAQQVHLLRHALAAAGDCVATLPRHGYRFVAPVEEDVEAPVPVSVMHCLVWEGREFPLREGRTVVGRADDADVQIPLPSLSRRHARVEVRGDRATLEDLDSRNGTWRGTTAVREATPLVSGDQLRLGAASLMYVRMAAGDTTRT